MFGLNPEQKRGQHAYNFLSRQYPGIICPLDQLVYRLKPHILLEQLPRHGHFEQNIPGRVVLLLGQ